MDPGYKKRQKREKENKDIWYQWTLLKKVLERGKRTGLR